MGVESRGAAAGGGVVFSIAFRRLASLLHQLGRYSLPVNSVFAFC